MQIISLWFFGFLFLWSLLYYAVPGKYRGLVLTTFSMVFFLTLRRIDVLAAGISFLNMILWTRKGSKSNLILGIAVQVLLMTVLKCVLFLPWLVSPWLPGIGVASSEGLAVTGLSFYSLQIISYMIEVFRGSIPREKPQKLFVYLFFTPKLSQGPIEKPEEMLSSLDKGKGRNEKWTLPGLQWILLGMVYKLAVAERLAPYVNNVFMDGSQTQGLHVLAGICLFSLQLYFDFAGYTLIAIGAGRVFGIPLTDNFNFPFVSRSVTEFWRRWHISLLRWLTEYVFTPLAFHFRRMGKVSVVLAAVVTFLLSGLWHGIGFTFLIWGGIHALLVVLEFLTIKPRRRLFDALPRWVSYAVGIFMTFTLFSLANVFFRAGSVAEALSVFERLFSRAESASSFPGDLTGGMEWENIFSFSLAIVTMLILLLAEPLLKKDLSGTKWQWPLLLGLILLLLLEGKLNGAQQFIYKQF